MSFEQFPGAAEPMPPEEEMKAEKEKQEERQFEIGQHVKTPNGGKLYIVGYDSETDRYELSNVEPGSEGAHVIGMSLSLEELKQAQETEPVKMERPREEDVVSEKREVSEGYKLAEELETLLGTYVGEYTSFGNGPDEARIKELLERIGETLPEGTRDQYDLFGRLNKENQQGKLAERFNQSIQ